MTEFAQWARLQAARCESAIAHHLPPAEQFPVSLHQAMHYAALGGGKRFRPLLVYATGEALEVAPERLDGLAAALDMLHTYSLVHDDLPAMDDDDLRRGKPSCHKAFGEATAILAGDALQALAFKVLASDAQLGASAGDRLQIIELIAQAIGSRGMAGGQAVDLASEGLRLSAAELEAMHIHKTGALIRASVLATSHARADVGPEQREALDHYAKCVGLAFQIHDDVLDETGTADSLGKAPGVDQARAKNTYPALFGLRESRAMASELVTRARAALAPFGPPARRLHELAQFVIERQA